MWIMNEAIRTKDKHTKSDLVIPKKLAFNTLWDKTGHHAAWVNAALID